MHATLSVDLFFFCKTRWKEGAVNSWHFTVSCCSSPSARRSNAGFGERRLLAGVRFLLYKFLNLNRPSGQEIKLSSGILSHLKHGELLSDVLCWGPEMNRDWSQVWQCETTYPFLWGFSLSRSELRRSLAEATFRNHDPRDLHLCLLGAMAWFEHLTLKHRQQENECRTAWLHVTC